MLALVRVYRICFPGWIWYNWYNLIIFHQKIFSKLPTNSPISSSQWRKIHPWRDLITFRPTSTCFKIWSKFIWREINSSSPTMATCGDSQPPTKTKMEGLKTGNIWGNRCLVAGAAPMKSNIIYLSMNIRLFSWHHHGSAWTQDTVFGLKGTARLNWSKVCVCKYSWHHSNSRQRFVRVEIGKGIFEHFLQRSSLACLMLFQVYTTPLFA